MNINNVYLADIYVKMTQIDYTEEDMDAPIGVLNTGVPSNKFVKETLVYKHKTKLHTIYIDLKSGKIYTNYGEDNANIGEFYIAEGLLPYSTLIETNIKNMSIRKILKNYKNTRK